MRSNIERNFVQEAHEAGSKANTVKGAVRALIKARERGIRRFGQSTRMYDFEYNSDQNQRKADPEAKAARNGYRRKQFLASLRRREKRALAIKEPDNVWSVTEAYENTPKRNRELLEVHRLRGIANVTGRKLYLFSVPDNVVEIPVDADVSADVGFPAVKRGDDWRIYPTIGKSWVHHESGYTEWHNGKPRGYVRAVNDTYVRSFAIVLDDRNVVGLCHDTEYLVKLPEGFSFGIDGDGLKAYMVNSPKDDYHVTAADMLDPAAADGIVAKLERNRAKRLETAAKEAALQAELEGIYICYDDSIQAGNCTVGTTSFAIRHGLDTGKHYKATELLKMNDNPGRVRLAIMAAKIRHNRDMKQGFCKLK